MSQKEYDNFEDWQQRFYDTRFRDIFDYATSEWIIQSHDVEKDNKTDIIECQLCGKKHLKLISRIKNKKTGEELIVGSSCINDYDQMKDSFGRNSKQIRNEQNNETNTILHNEQLLEKKSKNILFDIERFNKIRINDDIIIRKDIENRYNTLNIDVEKINKYLKIKKVSNDKINEIITIHNNLKQFLTNYDKYIADSKSSLFGLNVEVSKWCNIHCEYNMIERLKMIGKIDKETIAYIGEIGFLKKIIPLFHTMFQSNKINFLDKNIGVFFEIQFEDTPNVIVNINSRDFIADYKEYIFDKVNMTIDKCKLKKNCTITNGKSLESALFLICNGKFEKEYCQVKFYDTQLNELAFYQNKTIKVVNYKQFVNDFKSLVFDKMITRENSKKICMYIDENCKKYSYISYKEYLRNFGINFK